MKYNVGDKVIVKEDITVKDIYGGEQFVPKGKVFTIEEVRENSYFVKGNLLLFTDEALESKETEKYSIIIDGNEVIAQSDDGEYTGTAECNPDDEADLANGINLAIKKLRAEAKKWPPIGTKYYQVRINLYGEAECSDPHKFQKDKYDCHYLEVGNFFKTREEAEEMAKRINELMKNNI